MSRFRQNWIYDPGDNQMAVAEKLKIINCETRSQFMCKSLIIKVVAVVAGNSILIYPRQPKLAASSPPYLVVAHYPLPLWGRGMVRNNQMEDATATGVGPEKETRT